MIKIDASIIDLVFPQDVVPHQEPSFPSPTQRDPLSSSLLGEHIPISSQGLTCIQKMSWRKNRRLGGMSPTSGHHVEVKMLASIGYARGKVPNYGHHFGK